MEVGTNNQLPSLEAKKKAKKRKQRISPLPFLARTLPQALCQTKRESYCSGLIDSVQVEVVIDAVLKRTTASANEQK